MLFDLGVRELHLFLRQGRALLKSEERLQQTLEHELGIQLGRLSGGRLLEVGIVLGQGLGLGLCRNQSLVLHSQYTHSFNIIDGPWL